MKKINLPTLALVCVSFLSLVGSTQGHAQDYQGNNDPKWINSGGNLYVPAATKIGIGTSTPSRNLEIYNTATIFARIHSRGGALLGSQTAGIELRRSLLNGTNTTWSLTNEGIFSIKNNNVGVFSMTPSYARFGASIDIPIEFAIFGKNVVKTQYGVGGGALLLESKSDNQIQSLRIDGNQLESSHAMYLNNDSNRDISLVNGGGKLKVNTTDGESRLNIASSSDMQLKLINSGTGGGAWRLGVGNSSWASGSGKLFFSRTNNPADATMVITPAGNVGIGLTTPSKTLQVNGTTSTKVLEITGGADLAEHFDVTGSELPLPGMVVSIDPQKPGQLRIASGAYDKTVAGIVSGAGDVQPGMLMGQAGTLANGQYPVALTGRVYCRVDASHGAIRPGDLLTTSPTTGHAMKVTDPQQAQGAIIGKAMTSLERGKGLVLVLVSLQ